MKHSIVVATSNAHKLGELRSLFQDLDVELLSMTDVLGAPLDVVEDGKTFEDNARKKAVAIANTTHMMTLADDSGLEVDVLHGAPGVRSARYAHDRATDAENNAHLLRALENFGEEANLLARFRCVLCLVDPYSFEGEPQFAHGTCEGSITKNARGAQGFGYDPLFVVASKNRTMAELTEKEKGELSHRGQASRMMKLVLEKTLAVRSLSIARVEGK